MAGTAPIGDGLPLARPTKQGGARPPRAAPPKKRKKVPAATQHLPAPTPAASSLPNVVDGATMADDLEMFDGMPQRYFSPCGEGRGPTVVRPRAGESLPPREERTAPRPVKLQRKIPASRLRDKSGGSGSSGSATPPMPPPVPSPSASRVRHEGAAVEGVRVEDTGALDCGVCFRPLKARIFQCNAGHVVCSPCRDKLQASCKCHVCGITISGYSRCHAMERLVESISFPCPNAISGCTARLAYHDLKSHCQMCQHTKVLDGEVVMRVGGSMQHRRYWIGNNTLDTATTPTLSQIRARSTSSGPAIRPWPDTAQSQMEALQVELEEVRRLRDMAQRMEADRQRMEAHQQQMMAHIFQWMQSLSEKMGQPIPPMLFPALPPLASTLNQSAIQSVGSNNGPHDQDLSP